MTNSLTPELIESLSPAAQLAVVCLQQSDRSTSPKAFETPPKDNQPKKEGESEESNSDGLSNDMKACIQTICHGIIIGSADLFPLSVHQKRTLFQMDKLVEYSKQNIQHETGHKIEKIQGSSFREFTKNFSASMGGDANLAPILTNAAKAEVNISQEETKSNTTSFAQHRIQVYQSRLQLPLSSSPSTRKDIRELLLEEVRKEIDEISTYSDAKKFLANNGYLYVEKAYFGGSLIATSKSIVRKWFKSKSADATVDLFVGKGNINNSASASQTENIATSYSNDSTKRVGGPAYFGDADEWMKAIGKCQTNKNIIQCMFRPIHSLAIPGSSSERFLKLCHLSKFEPIQRNAEYIIQNVRSQCVLNLEGDIPLLRKPGNTLDDASKIASKIEVEIINMGDNLNQEHIKAALSRSSIEETDIQCKFLGVKRLASIRRDCVRISEQSFLQKKRNQLSLRRVEDNVFVISCSSGALGAVETKNGEYKFYLETNNDGSDVSKYSEDFHWEFLRYIDGSVEEAEDAITEEEQMKTIQKLEGKIRTSQKNNLQKFILGPFKTRNMNIDGINDDLVDYGINPDQFKKMFSEMETPAIDNEFVKTMKDKYESYFFENLIQKLKNDDPSFVINLYQRMRYDDILLRILLSYDKNKDGKLDREEREAALGKIQELLQSHFSQKDLEKVTGELERDNVTSITKIHAAMKLVMKETEED